MEPKCLGEFRNVVLEEIVENQMVKKVTNEGVIERMPTVFFYGL